MPVHAPFRFAPINRWVWFPSWGPLVSHDVPFKDGVSGEIEIEITAETPLLVGGPRRKATQQLEGEVWPFETIVDGERRYAIPGSSIDGMLRSILEIAAFGKLGPHIDKKRFGIRDLSKAAEPYYRDILVGKVKAGFLRKTDECWEIKPCASDPIRRIRFADIPGRDPAYDWSRKSPAGERYMKVATVGPFEEFGEPLKVKLRPHARGNKAWLVVTGNTGTRQKPKGREFVFVEAESKPIPLEKKVVEDFRFINQAGSLSDEDRDDWNETWKYFWESGYPTSSPVPFSDGGHLPVFYILDPNNPNRISAFGLASMFKLAHAATTHDLLRNSHNDHLNGVDDDLASLIFGHISEDVSKRARALARRVSIDCARLAPDSGVRFNSIEHAVLLSPKPSYFPSYVRQPGVDGLLATPHQYATYTPLNVQRHELRAPELAGTKIWPSRDRISDRFYPPYLPIGQANHSQKTLGKLNALQSGTFATTLRFHNLRPVELGAILWALSFGRKEAWGRSVQDVVLRHRLGGAKPYGLGEVKIGIRSLRARSHVAGSVSSDIAAFIDQFERDMRTVYARARADAAQGTWDKSVQVQTLLKAANPMGGSEADTVLDRRPWGRHAWNVQSLDYMELNPSTNPPGWNDFQTAKKQLAFMTPFATGDEFPKEPSSGVSAQSAEARAGYAQAATPQAESGLRKGDYVTIPETGESGIIQRIAGDAIYVDVVGETEPIPFNKSQLRKATPPGAPPRNPRHTKPFRSR